MEVILRPLLDVLLVAINLYIWVVIIGVILSWLVHFNVINRSNQFVNMIGEFCYRATEPALGRIRRLLPNLGGLDISPVILILALIFVEGVIKQLRFNIG